jgi:hypothetical protein
MSVRPSGTLEAGLPREMVLSQVPPSQTTFPATVTLTIFSIGVKGETRPCSCLQAATVGRPSLRISAGLQICQSVQF